MKQNWWKNNKKRRQTDGRNISIENYIEQYVQGSRKNIYFVTVLYTHIVLWACV